MNHNDDRVGRDYRAASAALDERPAPATRAAVLAAAAREANARPRGDAGSSAPRRAKQRWPMAAAAAVLLSTLAALLTVRTEREMPSFTAPTVDEQAPPTSPAVRSPPSVSGPAATPPAAADAPRVPAAVQTPPDTPTAAAQPAAKPTAPALAKRAPSAPVAAEMQTSHDQPQSTQEGARDAVAPEGRSRAKEESVASRAAPAAGPAEPATSGAIEARQANRAATPPAAAVATEKQRQDRAERGNAVPLREPGAGTSGAASGNASASAAVEADASGARTMRAEDWLEKIIKLRREGRDAEADAELKLFRERFPQVRVPADALGPTGTR